MTAMMIRPMDGKDLSQLRVAIIHFWLTGMRGGERVVESLCRMFPKADIYTNVVRPEALSQTLLTHPIHTTFIQKLPGSIKHYQKYFPLMPLALEQLDLRGYDLVISSESGPAKGVITRADTPHICYCHSPMRYLWDFYQDYLDSTGPATRFLMRPLFHRLRLWDYASVQRVDHIIANSRAVQRRVKRWWGRESTVIHPPVDVSAFANPDMSQLKNVLGQPVPGSYYICLGQLVSYKRVDLAVQACTATGRNLIVSGDGPERKNWRRWLVRRFVLWDARPVKLFPHSTPDARLFSFRVRKTLELLHWKLLQRAVPSSPMEKMVHWTASYQMKQVYFLNSKIPIP